MNNRYLIIISYISIHFRYIQFFMLSCPQGHQHATRPHSNLLKNNSNFALMRSLQILKLDYATLFEPDSRTLCYGVAGTIIVQQFEKDY